MSQSGRVFALVVVSASVTVTGCGDDAPAECTAIPFATGDADGHDDPLGSSESQARAGRISGTELDAVPRGMLTWADGDFVLANDKIALIIEDVGDSDLYDPWGGRPVGMARVDGGALADPADFGEFFLVTGPSTVATTAVTVINDGSNGEAAVIRASGKLAPLPFISGILSALYFDALTDLEAAIDYVLEPGAEKVDIIFRYSSPRTVDVDSGGLLHGFMYAERMLGAVPGKGFTDQFGNASWIEMIDDNGMSWAYRSADGSMGSAIAQSGFIGTVGDTLVIPRCGVSEHRHAELLIGGVGIDGLEQARARFLGDDQRTITGTVTDGTLPMAGARVHAVDGDGEYLTRAPVDASGNYTLHVPADAAVTLTAYRRGWATGTTSVAASATTGNITMPPSGSITVTPTDADSLAGLPARIQILPAGTSVIPEVPREFGEFLGTSGRLHVAYGTGAPVTLPVPPGDWQVVVSRGYEYELADTDVTVIAGVTTPVAALLEHVVDTTNIQCGDFHIHTHRSNDSGDDATEKLRSAVAEGLELPVRTDHEWVDSFQDIIEELGLTAFAFGIGSVEMTSFQVWGHFNVFPLDPDPSKSNQGTPRWQVWPTADDPDIEVDTMTPPEAFELVRARPESPTIIINHPRGGADYFNHVGYDNLTDLRDKEEDWDEEFVLIEVFNDADWLNERNRVVADWFSILNSGRPVYAVGSSDSHSIRSSPLGYPRTCIEVGTDNPAALTADIVRDQLAAGHAVVSGGIYLDVAVGAAGPGDTATGTTATAQVIPRVQAASWIDVDKIDVVVDGVTVQTIDILLADADAGNPAIRYSAPIAVSVAAEGSWVVLAVYGDLPLDPVHPGKIPFAVSNPIFLQR